MSGLGSARAPDLAATIVAALFAIGVALLADSGPVATVALLPLVLVLPGYALTAALFPPGTIDRDFRVVLVAALSIGVTALSGLVLQVFVDLSRGVVAASLAAVTIAAAIAAWRERREHHRDVATRSWPWLSAGSAVALLAAVAIAGVAIAIASGGANRQLDAPRFSALWLVPQGAPGIPPNGPPVIVGVSNREGRETGYRLSVRHGRSTVGVWRLRLAAGGEWETTLAASELRGAGPLVARLDRAERAYRRVALELDSRPGSIADE